MNIYILVAISVGIFLVVPFLISIWVSFRFSKKIMHNESLFKTFILSASLFITSFFLFRTVISFVLFSLLGPLGGLLFYIVGSGLNTISFNHTELLYLVCYMVGLVFIFLKSVMLQREKSITAPFPSVQISSDDSASSNTTFLNKLLWILPIFALGVLLFNFKGLALELVARWGITETAHSPALCKNLTSSSGILSDTDRMVAECVIKSIPPGDTITNYCDYLPKYHLLEVNGEILTNSTCRLQKAIETKDPSSCKRLEDSSTYGNSLEPLTYEKCMAHFPDSQEHTEYCSSLEKSPGQISFGSLMIANCINDGNANLRDSDGATPLFYAKTEEDMNILFLHKADPKIVDNNGNTPLLAYLSHIPSGREVPQDLPGKAVKVLLEKGSNPNAMNKDKYTPLIASIIEFNTPDKVMADIIKLLLQYKADVHLSGYGGTPCELIKDYPAASTEYIKPFCL